MHAFASCINAARVPRGDGQFRSMFYNQIRMSVEGITQITTARTIGVTSYLSQAATGRQTSGMVVAVVESEGADESAAA